MENVHTLARSILKTEPWSLYHSNIEGTEMVKKPGTGVVTEVSCVALLTRALAPLHIEQ